MAMTEKKDRKGENSPVVILGNTTNFDGVLRFKETLRIQGRFRGSIEATGALIVDKDAHVEASPISVSSLTVYGTVIGAVHAVDKIDMMSGAVVHGDVKAARLRIADGVQFDGQCSMTGLDRSEVEIFSRPTAEIKAELQRSHG
jgi:cytoskeletal protein CcmA (bactofilin family)